MPNYTVRPPKGGLLFLLTSKKLGCIFMHMLTLERLGETKSRFSATLRSPEAIRMGAGVLGIAGINLAPEVHDEIMTGDSVIVAIDCAKEQVRRICRANKRRRQRHRELIESRAEAGIVRHDVLRRALDSISTLSSDDMSCRLTKHDVSLWDYVDQLGRELCE